MLACERREAVLICAAEQLKTLYARIHETNLKKQGLLPLTFIAPADYGRFEQNDRVSIVGLHALEPGQAVTARIKKPGGKFEEIQARHTLTRERIAWFKVGSALNAAQEMKVHGR